jgi:hypothetical protein
MKCANCQNIKRHQQASMAMYRAGFCGCAKQPAYVYMTRLYERQCNDFQPKAAA